MSEIVDAARELAKITAKNAITGYQNELLMIINDALKQGYTHDQIINALLAELSKDKN